MIGGFVWMVIGGVVALKSRRKAIAAVDQYVPVSVQRHIIKTARSLADELTKNDERRRAEAPIETKVVDDNSRPAGKPPY